MKPVRVFAYAVLAVGLLLGGCGTDLTNGDRDELRHEGAISWVEGYGSLEELIEGSELIATVSATGGVSVVGPDEFGMGGDATISTVQVLKRLKGDSHDSTEIRQSGSDRIVFAGLGEILKPGETYLLFLNPFEFLDGDAMDEWLPTGEVGVYRLVGDRFVRTADDAVGLPESLSAKDPLGIE